MISILEQFYNQFLSEFPESWLPDGEDENVLFDKSTQLDRFFETCFIQLSKSIISGEYIGTPNFIDILNRFLEKTAAVEYAPLASRNSKVDKLLSSYRDLNYSIYNSLKRYNSFIIVSKKKFNTEEDKYKYGFYRLKKEESTDNDLILFSEIVIPLCICDYQFPANEDKFQDLLIIRNRLMEYTSEGSAERKAILSILLQKCHFIIRKIKQTPFYCNIESTVELIIPMEINIGSYEGFIKEECNSASKAEELLIDINGKNPNMKSFVLLMKYYKQNLTDKSDIDKMSFVLNQFSNIYQIKRDTKAFISPSNSIEEYDKFSLNSIFNFLHNCYFSFYTQKCEPNLKQIKDQLRHIENIQARTGVKNFHPYEKAIEAIIKCIEFHIGKDNFDDRLIEDKLEELNRVILLYEEAYEWSKSHQFFPFQLPFEESMYSASDCTTKLFMPSAYARYINYDTLKDKLEHFNRSKEYLRFRCDLSIERKEITQIKDDIKTSDKKAIDLIALFTASITFLFGIVNVFVVNNNQSIAELISNTMGLGIMLALFMCVYLLISPILIQKIDWKHFLLTGRFMFGILGVLIYLVVLFSIVFGPNSSSSKVKTPSQVSVENKVKSDTIISSKFEIGVSK
ncbi:hypothetical protein [Bacteroides thetaiotaomicron]|uniref:Uncharacterized protein n=1 Tax=Bacteroides thetaiotaomicron TaxID=818 RepID=A0A174UPU2_BACT4|nr:hypothetical protein [Bacteroides thetaiotaomicron]CUQ24494.1 Uncharacterised protein [Bacteroides thetaiotaomicron]